MSEHHYVQPIPAIELVPLGDPDPERHWLQQALQSWLDSEYLPEAINAQIADRATSIYIRQRLEGENDLGSLVVAIITEMQAFDFSKSFYGEFAIANAVSDLLTERLKLDRCCGG
jgi:hypothetical protein